MRSIAKAFKEKDEYKTPSCLVYPIIPLIENWKKENKIKNPIIWCPFDTKNSKYVEILSKKYTVINSHIQDGKDFFLYQPENYDIAISNPPFSLKLKIFERLVNLKKPFAMLMNIMAINYQEIGHFFASLGNGDEVQFFITDKKVSFDGKTSSFNSGYVCWNFIPRTKFIYLDNNNSGANFKE